MSNMRRTFSKKLTRTILLQAIILFIVILGLFFRQANALLHKEAAEKSTTVLNSTVQLVVNYLTAIETAAQSNLWMMEENFNPDSLQAISRRIVQLNRSVLSCSISAEPNAFPQYGKYFSVYSVNDGDTVITVQEPEFEYFEKNWYKTPMRLGRPCWINPFSDFNEGVINHHAAVGSYCLPIRPQGDHIGGVVSVDFSFQKLRETVLATHHPYPSSYYMLLGPSGGYLIHPVSKLLFKNTIFSANDSIEHPDIIKLGREMTAGHHGAMHVMLDGVYSHVCYAPVSDTGWSLALVCDDDDVLKDYNYLALITIAFIVIGMVIISLITRSVVRRTIVPLNELMEATKRITEGKHHAIIPVSDHQDVVGKLQNSFRWMQVAIIQRANNVQKTIDEIETENEALEHSMHVASQVSERRDKFIHDVKHQINTPLNIINGLIVVLQNKLSSRSKQSSSGKSQDNEDMSSIFYELKHNATQLYRMTLMLYDSSSKGMADMSRYKKDEDVKCNELVRECIEHTKKYYPVDNIVFKTDLPDSFSIKSSHLFMMRTISELLHNAAKYSDRQHISVSVTQTETTVRFIVVDTGPGLSKNTEILVFEPFTKVDDLSEGLGLGLPLCKKHTAELGGKLIYDADYTQGCRFIVEMPKNFVDTDQKEDN